MKKRNLILIGIAVVAAIILIVVFTRTEKKAGSDVTVKVKRGRLDVIVTTTGELQALNSEDIKGPFGLRQAGIWQVKISDLIPEGTRVKQGDYIATLDRSEVSSRMKDFSSELSKIESQYLQTRLDTALELRKLRDDLINLQSDMEEKKLQMEQSKFEPPAVIRQAELDLERVKRNYNQAQKNYKLKLEQSKAKMQEVAATLNIQREKLNQINTLLDDFVVKAPKDGMLIYKKSWDGRKVKAGSTISAWDLSVATLPDLSIMISQTFVNEIDISKLKMNQPVIISVDAFPDKKFKGKVISIANVGEQLPNNDTKVFEVNIRLEDKDTLLRPAMTTSNQIMTQSLENVLFIPVDAVQATDSVSYVFLRRGNHLVKQQVVTGVLGTDMVQIVRGLEEGDEIQVNTPDNPDDLAFRYLSGNAKTRSTGRENELPKKTNTSALTGSRRK